MDGDREFGRAREKAFRLLGRRAHGEGELRLKLESAGFSPAVVDNVIARCRELGYVDDGQFARQRAKSLASNRLAGNRRISFDLKGKGIADDLRGAAIADLDDEFNEADRIRLLLQKRRAHAALFGQDGKEMDSRDNVKEKAKLIRYLMSRGFSLELIMQAIHAKEEERFHDDDGE
jgi:regulatory protein